MEFRSDIRPPNALQMRKGHLRHAVYENRDRQEARNRRTVAGKIIAQPERQAFWRKNHQNQRERQQDDEDVFDPAFK